MTKVIAILNNTGQYLSKDEQMDEFLLEGFTLYLEENGKQELLATPDNGFILARPKLTQITTYNLKG